ncbi:hypothetical protein [Niveibacterium terrae]|uniref:hypothetical protein n=1 Tax=Niveibacterium terrae TaxID=3373598 RepID=UPI003A8CFB97
MNRHVARVVLLLVLLWGGAVLAAGEGETRFLFVGNSLSYVGNLPAVFDALCRANGHAVHSEMLVEGGATLADRVADSSVRLQLSAARYDYLVLQERGGDLIGGFGEEARLSSLAATTELTEIARRAGVQPLYLGTYQKLEAFSEQLVAAERELSGPLKLRFVPVSSGLVRGLRDYPELAWFARDGQHPGPDLTLLQAVRLYREVYGALPREQTLDVVAPIYGISTTFFPPALASMKALAREPAADRHHYDAATVRAVRILFGRETEETER